tara:strand:+ start:393 stop:593 length:201 start_codon:yes stop_codon:yes gene_type:complete
MELVADLQKDLPIGVVYLEMISALIMTGIINKFSPETLDDLDTVWMIAQNEDWVEPYDNDEGGRSQ